MAALAFTAASKGDHGAHKAAFAGGKSASFGFGPFKAVFGRLTFDTDYPDDGYTEAALVALAGLSPYISNIYAIIPISQAVYGSGETAYVLGWDMTTSTLRAFGSNGAADAGLAEAATGSNNLDGAVADVLIIGR